MPTDRTDRPVFISLPLACKKNMTIFEAETTNIPN